MTHVLWYNLIFTPLVQLEEININYKNLNVTSILENIPLFTELLISGIVYHVVEPDSLNAFKNRLDKYWTNQDVVYDYKSDLKGTGGLPVCV